MSVQPGELYPGTGFRPLVDADPESTAPLPFEEGLDRT